MSAPFVAADSKGQRPTPTAPERPKPPKVSRAVKSATNLSEREPERLLPVSEARLRLGGIARSAIYKLLAQRSLKSVKLGRRRMIVESSVDQLITRLARAA